MKTYKLMLWHWGGRVIYNAIKQTPIKLIDSSLLERLNHLIYKLNHLNLKLLNHS